MVERALGPAVAVIAPRRRRGLVGSPPASVSGLWLGSGTPCNPLASCVGFRA